MCSPHCVPHCVPNEIDYGKINVETNSGTAVSTRMTSLTWRHKKHWCSSSVFNVNFEEIPHLFLVFHCWIWDSVGSCVYQQRSKYRQVKITKHASMGTYKLCHINQMGQSTTWKENCIKFKKYFKRFLFSKNNFFKGKKL